MRKIVFLLVAILAVTPLSVMAAGETTEVTAEVAKEKVEYGYDISFDQADDGIVTLFYYLEDAPKTKLTIQNGSTRYVFNLFSNEEPVNYPLHLGEGEYTVKIYQNTSGSKYKVLTTEKYTVEYDEDSNVNAVYLQSILEINWDEEDESIQLADELVAEALEAKQAKVKEDKRDDVTLTEQEIVDVIYNYILENIEYDFDKIKTLDYSYVPNNDATLEIGTGICYDYSSLFASMLRSQGIPAKMVKGYARTSEVYHAWNEVYLDEEWVVVDTTYDAYRAQNDRSYDFEKDPEDFNKVKEF